MSPESTPLCERYLKKLKGAIFLCLLLFCSQELAQGVSQHTLINADNPAPKTSRRQDPALISILQLLSTNPDSPEISTRAWNWARRTNRVTELSTAILNEARSQRNELLFLRCAQFAILEGAPLSAIELLEEGMSLDSSDLCAQALARIWLQGGWVEAAQAIQIQRSVDTPTRYLLDLIAGAAADPKTLVPLNPRDRSFLIETFPRLHLSDQGIELFSSTGDESATFSVMLRSADLAGLNSLVKNRQLLLAESSPEEALAYSRLLGTPSADWFQQSPLMNSIWQMSMGYQPASSIPGPSNSSKLQSVLQMLEKACQRQDLKSARRLWVSLQLLLTPWEPAPDLSPLIQERLNDLIPPWFMPDQTAKSLASRTDQEAAQLARKTALHSKPGSETESRLWFQAGRLADSIEELERALRISPDLRFRTPLNDLGIIAEYTPKKVEVPIPLPKKFSGNRPENAVIGKLSGQRLRLDSPSIAGESWYLHEWHSNGADSEASTVLRNPSARYPLEIQLAGPDGTQLDIRGTAEKWLIRNSTSDESWSLTSEADSSLFDSDGLPRLKILKLLSDPEFKKLSIETPWDHWPPEVVDFIDHASQYLRSDHWKDQALVLRKPQQLEVSVGNITGVFKKIPRQTPWDATVEYSSLRFPSSPSQHLGIQRSEQLQGDKNNLQPGILISEWRSDSASADLSCDFPQNPKLILPPGEILLLVGGTDERVVITRSGLVGFFPQESAFASWWLPLLRSPLPGPKGFAPIPKEEHPPHRFWGDSATPRIRETRCGEQSVFLLIGDPLLQVEAAGATLIHPTKNYPGHCASAQLLTPEGKLPTTDSDSLQLWYIDSERRFLHGPKESIPLPAAGAYSLSGHPDGPLILGQHRGESWLAQRSAEDWIFIDLPTLPGERDRPQLRAAAMTVVDSTILLLADRLWSVSANQPPLPLTVAAPPGAYRAVRWVQPPPLIKGQLGILIRPWGAQELWKFGDE